MTFIYALRCPETGAVRYIGKSNDPARRLNAHVSRAISTGEQHHSANWIRALVARGLRPDLEVLAKVSPIEDWRDVERAYIAKAREAGLDLTNTSPGGEGVTRSPDGIRRSIEGTKRSWRDPAAREKRVNALKSAIRKKWDDPAYRERCVDSARRHQRRAAAENPDLHVKRLRAFLKEVDAPVVWRRDLTGFGSMRALSRHLSALCREQLIAEVSRGVYALCDEGGELRVPLERIAALIWERCGVDTSAYSITTSESGGVDVLRIGRSGKRISIERCVSFRGIYAHATRI